MTLPQTHFWVLEFLERPLLFPRKLTLFLKKLDFCADIPIFASYRSLKTHMGILIFGKDDYIIYIDVAEVADLLS